MRRPIAVAFVISSTGELHCLLPILAQAKQAQQDLRIVVVFKSRQTAARLAEDPVYSAVLRELGAELMHLRSLFGHVLTHRADIRLIFKEFGPTARHSLATLVKGVSPNAALVLFPHAFALHAAIPDPSAPDNTRADYDQELIDMLLLNSELDVPNWKAKVPERVIRVVGATGYTDWWRAILTRHARAQLEPFIDTAGAKKIVFLTTRGPHQVFLSPENYRYLMSQALEVILSRPDTLIVLKPHPREDVAHLKAVLARYPQDRVKLTLLNTLAVASIAHVNVSFWSSAVLDSLAVGTPTIEFHRFHRPNTQTVLDADGNVASMYTTLGLSLKADSGETLSRALDTALAGRDELLERQRAAFARCFPDNEARLATLRGVLRDLLAAPARPRSNASTSLDMLRLARSSARDLFDEVRERRGRR